MNYPRIASRLFNTPLMLRAQEAEVFAAVFNQIVVNVAAGAAPQPQAFAANAKSERYKDKPYVVTDGGVGILPVYGPLMHRGGQISADCTEFLSYQKLAKTYDAMVADRDVKGILLELDTPGGEVAGNFVLAARFAAGTKPLWAHANEGAYSAGYSLMSSAQRLYVPETGSVGSIGVVMMHVDQSQKDAKAGYAYTFIHAGARKVDFNSHEPLSKKALAVGQVEVDRLYGVFVQHIAGARKISADAVRATEAGILAPADAQQVGLIDGVASFDDTLAAFTESLRSKLFPSGGVSARRQPKGGTMKQETEGAAEQSQAEMDAALAKARSEGESIGKTAGQAAERTRISAILNCEESKGRSKMAQTLALETDLEPAAAQKLLTSAALEVKAETNPLAAAMAGVNNPAVGADGAVTEGVPVSAAWDRSFGKLTPAR